MTAQMKGKYLGPMKEQAKEVMLVYHLEFDLASEMGESYLWRLVLDLVLDLALKLTSSEMVRWMVRWMVRTMSSRFLFLYLFPS